jgi:hypothetical protein
MRGIGAGDDWTALLPGFLVCGIGIGLVNPALATAAIGVVEPRRAGMASGINSTFRQIGIATGTAALGAIFTHVVNGRREAFAEAAARAGLTARRGAGQFSDFVSFGLFRRIGGGEAVARAGRDAFLHGLHTLLLWGAVVAFAGAVASVVLIRRRDFEPQAASAREPVASEPAAV